VSLARVAIAVFLLLNAGAAVAADLEAVRKALTPLRQSTREPATRMRPEFLVARDGLRDWIESRLAQFPQGGDTAALGKALNAEITAMDLACVEAKAPGYDRCTSPGEFDARGFLGAVEVERVRDFLIVQAETGVPCGFDETAYVYEWVKTGWRRLLDTAQTSRDGVYFAEQIQQILFSSIDGMPLDALLLVATGVGPSCAGQYRPAHYRVWSAKREVGADLVVDGRENDAYVARREPAISARFEGADLLIEMDVRSMDASRRHRIAVRRFKFDRAEARLVAPFALSPRDFVEEWVRAPWGSVSAWTAPGAREALRAVHAGVNGALGGARFSGPTQRCEDERASMQLGLGFADGERFFRVKVEAGGAYVMQGAGFAPSPACTAADAGLDAVRSLF